MTVAPDVLIAARTDDLCGESPVWDPRTRRVHWVDILGRRVHALDTETGRVTTLETEDHPTALGLCRTPGLGVIAFAGGVRLIDLASGATRPLATLDEPEGNRLNEGAVGPDGAFWVGTMQSNIAPDGRVVDLTRRSGALWRVAADGTTNRVTPPMFGIANTLAWDVARGRVYVGDTLAHTTYVLPWPLPPGEHVPRIFSRIEAPGLPDGSEIDAEGHLWTARYDGGALLRVDPDGALAQRVDLPARNVTDACFGGPDLGTLYVTTARAGLEEGGAAQGALLVVRRAGTGHPPFLFDDGGIRP